MNKDDELIIRQVAERITTGTVEALAALKAAYALGVAREITDHQRFDPPVTA